MSTRSHTPLFGKTALFFLVVLVTVAACGNGESETATSAAEEDTSATQTTATVLEQQSTTSSEEPATTLNITLGLPFDSPDLFEIVIAEEVGYFAQEGIEVEIVFPGGSGAAVQQLLGGNLDVVAVGPNSVVPALAEGFTDLRSVFARVYGSTFQVAVPADSDIESAEDFAGRTIGISALSGGEVPVIRGMIAEAGLSESDVDLLAVGENPAAVIRALELGQIDGFGGGLSEIASVAAALDSELRLIPPAALDGVPSNTYVTMQDFLSENGDVLAGFFRAINKGHYWSQVNLDAAVALMKDVRPEQFTNEAGEIIMGIYTESNQPPEGVPRGTQTVEDWERLVEFANIDLPADVELANIVSNELIEAANDFDRDDVASDAQRYLENQ